MSVVKRIKIFPILCALILGGCALFDEQDYGPTEHVGVSHIKDAVPKDEPRSRGGNPDSYVVNGKRYHVRSTAEGYKQRGIASWYGYKFHGNKTSNGEVYDMYSMTAAHKTLPLGTYVQVYNRENSRSVVVRINDRGPFVRGRIIDSKPYGHFVQVFDANNLSGLLHRSCVPDDAPLPSSRS